MTSRTRLNLGLAFALAGLIALVFLEPDGNEIPIVKTLTQLKPDEVINIRVQSPGHTDIDLQKINGHWQMLAPFIAPANQHRLVQLLDVASAKSLATYNVDKTDTTQLKLDTPSLTLTLNNSRLDFGGTAPMGGSRYVRIDQSVHLITDRYSHLARGSATDLVSPSLLKASTKITALKLPTFKLALVDGQWQLENQPATKNPDQLQQLLDEWRHARAFDIKAFDTASNTSHTQNPETIIVTTDNSSLRFTLLRTDDEIILQRHDLGLQYHFSQEIGQQLLTLPQLNNI